MSQATSTASQRENPASILPAQPAGESDAALTRSETPAPIAGDETLATSYEMCRNLTRARARNFYHGLRLTAEPKRSSLYAIYAWMRAADDLVDSISRRCDAGEVGETGREMAAMESADCIRRLDRFRARTDRAFKNGRSALRHNGVTDFWPAFVDTVQRYELSAEPFHDMIAGQMDDARHEPIRTGNDLMEYCRRVASTVGEICISIWGIEDPTNLELARQGAKWQGIGFQLTNILRDFAEDLDAGRVYLPAEDFDRFGLTPQALRNWSDPGRCASMLQFEIDLARSFYEKAAPLMNVVHPDGRSALWAMIAIYRELLETLSRNVRRICDCNGDRVSVPAIRKVWIGLSAPIRSRLRTPW